MSTAYDRLLEALSVNGNGMAQCPAHDDTTPSLSVEQRRDGKGAVVYCHARCETPDVLAALGLTMADLFDEDELRAVFNPRRDYGYPGGRWVHRQPGKSFPQSGNKKDNSLYHADRIGGTATVYIPEGEKDVEAIEQIGGVAVCSAMGAGKAHKADWSPLRGKHVIIVADKDEPGRKHAAHIARLLHAVPAASVTIVEAAIGKDAADHVAAGRGLDEFVPIEKQDTSAPRLWNATDLKPAAQPRWLAKGRLPRAAISLLVGDEGIGKSLLWVWVAVPITTGKPLPEFGIPEREPGHVIVVCTEDDWCSTVRPRLEVAGADLTMIRVICTEDDGSGSPVFPRDLSLIATADPPPALVVVDAWLDTVAANLVVRDPQQARQALHPFKEVATVTEAAVLLLCHTNRVATPNARDRYGATAELRKKARMTLFAQQDGDGNLIVGPEKTNNAAQIPASKFVIKTIQHFPATEDHDGTVPLLEYAGESEQTAREHIAENFHADPRGSDDAITWLSEFLADGPRWARDGYRAAEDDKIPERTLKRAKLRLHVESVRYGASGPWFWRLPQHHGCPEGQPGCQPVSMWQPGTLGWSPEGQGTLSGTLPKNVPTSEECHNNITEIQGTTAVLPTQLSCSKCGTQLTRPISCSRGMCLECWTVSANDSQRESTP